MWFRGDSEKFIAQISQFWIFKYAYKISWRIYQYLIVCQKPRTSITLILSKFLILKESKQTHGSLSHMSIDKNDTIKILIYYLYFIVNKIRSYVITDTEPSVILIYLYSGNSLNSIGVNSISVIQFVSNYFNGVLLISLIS